MLQDAPANLCSSFVSICRCKLGQCRSRSYSDFTIPIKQINCLIHASSSKMAVKMSRVVKQLLNVLKLFRVTACCIHSFRIRCKETLRIMYRKYPVLDMIRRIHLRCG